MQKKPFDPSKPVVEGWFYSGEYRDLMGKNGRPMAWETLQRRVKIGMVLTKRVKGSSRLLYRVLLQAK
jgi:hypothetical protein